MFRWPQSTNKYDLFFFLIQKHTSSSSSVHWTDQSISGKLQAVNGKFMFYITRVYLKGPR